MKQQETKYINGVPVARLEDYGYRDFSILHKIWKIVSIILVYIVIFLVLALLLKRPLNKLFEGFTNKFASSRLSEH